MTAAPFLKWVGGKGKLFKTLAPLLPSDVASRRYFEPFVGGGAVFFALEPRLAVLSDVNPDLIDTYVAVRDEVDAVIDSLRDLAANSLREGSLRSRRTNDATRRVSRAKSPRV